MLLSGYAPEYACEMGRLDQSLPFEELKRRALINKAAQAADQALDFSRRIRAGLPETNEAREKPEEMQFGVTTRKGGVA